LPRVLQPNRHTPVGALRNLGPRTAAWLEAIGVRTDKDLRALGAIGAYRAVKGLGYPATLKLVYAVHAALEAIDWRDLPAADKALLKIQAADALRPRCQWCGTDPLYVAYHDREWGVPSHDDRHLFEMLILEGAQAGLSWSTILAKREGYRRAFAGFDAEKVARFGAREFARLMHDEGIVRNRLKIEAATKNARAFLAVREQHGTFDRYVWGFVGGEPIQNRWGAMKEVPARSPQSDAMSKDLQRRGFTFVGSTICYAFMQAVGMVNDHVASCFRYQPLARAARGRSAWDLDHPAGGPPEPTAPAR
jgi:DNA-3-methyladenine glycosylase I